MYKILFFIIGASVLSNAYVDLGVMGNSYPIKETNIKTEIKNRIRNLNKAELKRQILKSIEDSFASYISLPSSQNDRYYKPYVDFIIVDRNIVDPRNPSKFLYVAGQRLVSKLPRGKILNTCFIDGSNPVLAKAIVKEFGDCDYFIANIDIRKVNYIPENKKYPMNMNYVKRFKVDKYPTMITMSEEYIYKKELSVPRILEKIKNGRTK